MRKFDKELIQRFRWFRQGTNQKLRKFDKKPIPRLRRFRQETDLKIRKFRQGTDSKIEKVLTRNKENEFLPLTLIL